MPYEAKELEEKLHRWGTDLQHFRLPAWEELPDTGLQMVEVVALIQSRLDYLTEGRGEERSVTAAAINNYVRLRAMPRPKMRRYYRIHLAYILMICTLKQGMNLATIQQLLPCNLTEEELRPRYEAYVSRHSRLTAEFARSALQASLASLGRHEGDECARILIESAATVSSLSRLMAEKLLLPEDGNS